MTVSFTTKIFFLILHFRIAKPWRTVWNILLTKKYWMGRTCISAKSVGGRPGRSKVSRSTGRQMFWPFPSSASTSLEIKSAAKSSFLLNWIWQISAPIPKLIIGMSFMRHWCMMAIQPTRDIITVISRLIVVAGVGTYWASTYNSQKLSICKVFLLITLLFFIFRTWFFFEWDFFSN